MSRLSLDPLVSLSRQVRHVAVRPCQVPFHSGLEEQERRQRLKETYVQRIAKEVSPVRSLRFLQIESQLDALALVQTGRSVPLAE